MMKRVVFHFFNLVNLCLIIILSVFIYYYFSYLDLGVSSRLTYEFILSRSHNFILIATLTYFLIYLTGFIKYTIEDKYFSMVKYFKEIFKLVLVLITASFIEFFVFYEARIGRLIYLYLFVIYSLYYILYLWVRSERGPKQLLWLASVPGMKILEKYIKNPDAFHIIKTDQEQAEVGLDAYVVYQEGHIDEDSSEALIKNKLAGYSVIELVELIEKESGKIPLDYVNIHWFLEKFDVVDRNYFRSSRMFSIFLSLILLILLLLPGILAALAHKLFSKGPIFYIQQRVGLHGKVFKLIKFRTMVKNAEEEGAQFAEKKDHRITAIGKFMRRLRIDEIPQFFNILKGDMNMVGPRPERKVFIETLAKEVPYYKLRLLVPPGLTGWAQVNGVYAGNHIEDHKGKLEYDLFYIKNRSIFMDLLILLRTVKTIVLAKGE